MTASDDDILSQLREIFQGELADQVRLLQRQRVILRRDQSSEGERQEAIFEIYRAVHSLKGAARSVGDERIVRLCHGFEEALGDARHGVPVVLAVAQDVVDRALAELETYVDLDADSTRDPVLVPRAESSDETMRVPVSQVARLMRACDNLVGVLGETMAPNDFEGSMSLIRQALRSVKTFSLYPPGVQDSVAEALRACSGLTRTRALELSRAASGRAQLRRHVLEVTEQVRSLRLLSASDLCLSLEQAASEHAAELGKPISFTFRGRDTLLDREILGRIRAPLIHLVHNAIDHGLERPDQRSAIGKSPRGELTLEIETQGSEIRFSLADDGRGFDLAGLVSRAKAQGSLPADADLSEEEMLELAFLPGLSTHPVATETSGRGVGLDVVRRRVQELQGRVAFSTRAHEGTRIDAWIPTQLNAVTALVLLCDHVEYLLPIAAVERVLRPRPDQLKVLEEGRWLIPSEDHVLPLTPLSVLLDTGTTPHDGPCVIVVHGTRRVALQVERVLDVRHTVARPLNRRASGSPFVSSAALSADGLVLPVLDVEELVRRARPGPPVDTDPMKLRRRILVVDDSITTRQLVRSILEAAGHEVALAEDGDAAWRAITHRGPFDLVVSDIEMPILNGLQLLGRVRGARSTSTLPFVLVTALESDDDRRRAMDLGADAYVVKSAFDQQNLLDTVTDLLQ